MIRRDSEKTILSLLKGFPIVTITGPRQSGKTTLAKAIFPDKPYASLEEPDVRLAARDDPRSFLDRFPGGAVLDEVQRCPEILSYLQSRVDADGRMGLFILTESQHFGLLAGITQSLAGRTGFLELLPFSLHELTAAGKAPPDINRMLFTGGYPPIYDREVSVRNWFSAYVTAYIERDVRQVLKVQELETFQRFVRLCAGRTGQLVNYSTLAVDCGITHNTAKAWLSVLEASYILFLLRPHHINFNKRLIKAPKLYFYDVGLASWLLGIRDPDQIETHPLRGNLFETFVVAEWVKSFRNRGEQTAFYFWRDSNGVEVDLLIEQGMRLMPVEIKSGKTVAHDFFASLNKWTELAGDLAEDPTMVYGGREDFRHKGIRIISWRHLGT
ncbi:MAG: AAA family ATPase [Desulfobacterales bacterium CG07_land_8_20_14_0_80_52_14]|nr:MAG: AAA family ATPase [Desulfobacterales bacterium CG07_land_8_20_14_0_80_52_14]